MNRREPPSVHRRRVEAFNSKHPVGAPVRYWTGLREGEGKLSHTRSIAAMLSGHTAVVWVEGHSACIALTHIEPLLVNVRAHRNEPAEPGGLATYVVVGTNQIAEAARYLPSVVQKWRGSFAGAMIKRDGVWREVADPNRLPKRARAGVMFVGCTEVEESGNGQ